MAVVQPFRAVRYDERAAGPLGALVAPPYDVIGPAQRERYLAASPHNVVRLTLPDSEEQAARDLAEWRREGVLVRDEEPALWWLSQDFEGPDGVRRTRTGVVASVRVEPYERRVILPHERTHSGPKEGRLRLLRAVRVQLEPIFLLYRDPEGEPRRTLEPLAVGEPDLEASDGGVRSRLWRIGDERAVDRVASALAERQLLIADGHHRYETAVRFHEEEGTPESAFTLAVVVNSEGEGLTIFATHRVVERLGEVTGEHVPEGPRAALDRIAALPRDRAAVVLYRDGRASIVEGDEGQLDAALVESLGAEGVTYTPDAGEAVAAADGAAAAAFLLRPVSFEQVAAVAEAGRTMPQKSTYFYPKLLSGLLFHPV